MFDIYIERLLLFFLKYLETFFLKSNSLILKKEGTILYEDLNSIYKLVVFCRKEGNKSNLGDYVVLFELRDKNMNITSKFVVSAQDLLYLTQGKKIASLSGKERLSMYSLDKKKLTLDMIRIMDANSKREEVYFGFHKAREIVRHILCKNDILRQQIEQINREIALIEIQEYRAYCYYRDEQEFFTKYFCERFPKSSKEKYSGNIGMMFGYYSKCFLLPCLPVAVYKEKTKTFRTKYRDIFCADYYRYPIKIPNYVFDTQYFAKAVVCTVLEMNIFFPGINDNIVPSDKQ